MRNYLRTNPGQSRPRPLPYARLNITIRTPVDFGPELMGIPMLGNWSISILANWKAGQYTTYNPGNLPGVVDNIRWKDWYNLDMRISRDFRMMHSGFQIFINISNVFNFKHMNRAGFSGTFDWEDYLGSLRLPFRDGIFKGNDRIGDYRPWNVAYDPLEPNPHNDTEIDARNKKRINDRSYIDNPSIRSLAFLNPRQITFGIRIDL